MTRRLVLRRETLIELSGDDLASVAAGIYGSTSCVGYTLLPSGCNCSGPYPSLNEPCPTITITQAIISGGC